jgi:cyclic pyranopterin phosphate synthase
MTKLTHLDEVGNAAMVDISAKTATVREAVAEGRIAMSAQALAAIKAGAVKKATCLPRPGSQALWPQRRRLS